MNVYRVNYAKVGVLLSSKIGNGAEMAGNCPALSAPSIFPAVNRGLSALPQNFGRAGPSSDLVFPTSACVYAEKNSVCVASLPEPVRKEYDNTRKPEQEIRDDLDLRELNKVLEEKIRKATKPCGLMVPTNLRKNCDSLRTAAITSSTTTNKNPHQSTKDNKMPPMKNVITGTIVFDRKRTVTAPPASRILLDETKCVVEDGSDTESEYESEYESQNGFDRDQYNFSHINGEKIRYDHHLQDTKGNRYDHRLQDTKGNRYDHHLQDTKGNRYDHHLQDTKGKGACESKVVFYSATDKGGDDDELFLEIDPKHLNERNETMFKMYGQSKTSQEKGNLTCGGKSDCGQKSVTWAIDHNMRILESLSAGCLNEEVKKDFVNRCNMEIMSNTNRYGEQFNVSTHLYHNHIDLDKHTVSYLSMGGQKCAGKSLQLCKVGDFSHLLVKFYSFVGKKKNQKIVFHSLTEYELWCFENKGTHYVCPLPLKNEKDIETKANKLRDQDEEDDSQTFPSQRYTQKIIYSSDPLISSMIEFYVEDNYLFVTLQFDQSYPKYFSTNYAKMHVDQMIRLV